MLQAKKLQPCCLNTSGMWCRMCKKYKMYNLASVLLKYVFYCICICVGVFWNVAKLWLSEGLSLGIEASQLGFN